MLARLFGQSENVLAILATAVHVRFSVAYAVALEAEKAGEAFYKSQKVRIFLASFVKILREISEKSPRDQCDISDVDDQLRDTLQKQRDNDKKQTNDQKKIIERVNSVAPLHEAPDPLA